MHAWRTPPARLRVYEHTPSSIGEEEEEELRERMAANSINSYNDYGNANGAAKPLGASGKAPRSSSFVY